MFRSYTWLVEEGKYSGSSSGWNQNLIQQKNKPSYRKKRKEMTLKGGAGGMLADGFSRLWWLWWGWWINQRLWSDRSSCQSLASRPAPPSCMSFKSPPNCLLCSEWRQNTLSRGLLWCQWLVIFHFMRSDPSLLRFTVLPQPPLISSCVTGPMEASPGHHSPRFSFFTAEQSRDRVWQCRWGSVAAAFKST